MTVIKMVIKVFDSRDYLKHSSIVLVSPRELAFLMVDLCEEFPPQEGFRFRVEEVD